MLSLAAVPAAAEAQATRALLDYQAYAAGLHILSVQAMVDIGPRNFEFDTRYQTTGLIGLFRRGHQLATVHGAWRGAAAEPGEFLSEGVWQGEARRTLIGYDHGQPELRALVPANPPDRSPVPAGLQTGSKDVLSAIAELMRQAGRTGACDVSVRIFDGRTLNLVVARSAGSVELASGDRSTFAGRALRCDFDGRVLAGLRRDESPDGARRLHGSIWLGRIWPGALPVPVRISVQTRWFGEATLYLTAAHALGAVGEAPGGPHS